MPVPSTNMVVTSTPPPAPRPPPVCSCVCKKRGGVYVPKFDRIGSIECPLGALQTCLDFIFPGKPGGAALSKSSHHPFALLRCATNSPTATMHLIYYLGIARGLGHRSAPPMRTTPKYEGKCVLRNGGHSEGVFLLRGRQPLRFRRLVGLLRSRSYTARNPVNGLCLGHATCNGARAVLWREW
jgi:hypothetical protein